MFDFITKPFSESNNYQPVARDIFKAYNSARPDGPKDLICYVPFNSLTFSWLGKVYACTYNRNILVGEYPQNSIRDIWFGEPIKKLRGYIQHNDLNYGCQHCKYFVEKGKFTGLKPQSFDKYSDYKEDGYPRVMEFETSSKCNLECIMCNGNTSSSIRQNRDKLPPLPTPYDDAFIEQMKEFIPHLKEAKFFGGEPFLVHSYFQIWDQMMELNPAISIFVITNGTILTDKVKELLHKGNFELAVSIDSIRKERYEYIRKNASFETVMENLDYFNQYTQSRGRTMSLSFTTQRENWDELAEVIEFCNKKGIIFFNSFLTAPFELSLIFLPSEKLKEIHAYLAKFILPESTTVEKYNKSVFNDYLKYLKYYEEKNRNGIDVSEQKDNYGDVIISDREGTRNFQTRPFTDREDFFNVILQAIPSPNRLPNEEIIARLQVMFQTLNDAAVEERILKDVSRAPLGKMLNDVSVWTHEELMTNIRSKFCRTEEAHSQSRMKKEK
ncbi:MAG: twitch domain-containing radical SAM protein [Bacteroidota bacterium]